MDFKMPPNWLRHTHIALSTQLPYHTIQIAPASDEYSVVSSMLDGVHVKSVEQVINFTLWDRFQQRRKEMLKSKSIDAAELSSIGLNEVEVREVLAYSRNFTPHIEVAHVPFDHNMALLFHCSSSEENVENILTEGLDERLGNLGGLLGRGIYFADDPMKSMSYDRCNIIMIFAVLLGDCLSMDDKQVQFVREPKKRDDQKRHLNDLFFDSIAGKPMNHNEYVIYNRYQCLPLYKVRYAKSNASFCNGHTGRKFDSDEYVQARKDFPELCWKLSDKYEHPMPSLMRLRKRSWPFAADKIFGKMGV